MKYGSVRRSESSPPGTPATSKKDASRSRFVPQPRAGIILTERDKDVLWHCFLLRCLRRDQIERLGFGSLQRCNSRLRLLYDWRYVTRYVPSAARYGAQATYSIGPTAVPYVTARARSIGWDLTQEDIRVQSRRPAATLLDHAIAICDVYLAFRKAFVDVEGFRFQFLPERLVRAEYEIRRVGAYEGSAHRPRREVFAPDGGLRIRVGNDICLSLFLEADSGTMGMAQWAGKLEVFARYAASGMAAGIYSVDELAMVAVTMGARRAHSLCRLATEYTGIRFIATTFDDLRAQGPLGPIWQEPGKNAAHGLLDIPWNDRGG